MKQKVNKYCVFPGACADLLSLARKKKLLFPMGRDGQLLGTKPDKVDGCWV
ncbi:MAG: hypothetical protein WBV73_07920 [Phormidium sp.]